MLSKPPRQRTCPGLCATCSVRVSVSWNSSVSLWVPRPYLLDLLMAWNAETSLLLTRWLMDIRWGHFPSKLFFCFQTPFRSISFLYGGDTVNSCTPLIQTNLQANPQSTTYIHLGKSSVSNRHSCKQRVSPFRDSVEMIHRRIHHLESLELCPQCPCWPGEERVVERKDSVLRDGGSKARADSCASQTLSFLKRTVSFLQLGAAF